MLRKEETVEDYLKRGGVVTVLEMQPIDFTKEVGFSCKKKGIGDVMNWKDASNYYGKLNKTKKQDQDSK